MLGEMIFEVVFNCVLIFPGALMRWVIGGCKRKFSVYLEDTELSSFFGIILFTLVVVFVAL